LGLLARFLSPFLKNLGGKAGKKHILVSFFGPQKKSKIDKSGWKKQLTFDKLNGKVDQLKATKKAKVS